MKSATSSTSWISRNHRDSPTPSSNSLQVPTTPTYTAPRSAPKPPGGQGSPFKAFHTVFRKQNRAPSIRSAYSASTTSSENQTSHPYAAMHIAPMPVVSSHDADDEEECPVCLEPLSFSFRLPGEKPHIVPECGHALHEVRSFYYLTNRKGARESPRHVLLPSMALHRVKLDPPWPENLISEFVVSVGDP